MLERDSIDPIMYYGINKCPKCNSILTIVDMETSFLELADNGSPINETTLVKAEAVCRNCGYKAPMMRDGMSYKYDNEVNRIDKEHYICMKQAEVRKRMDSLKPTKDNPFCINVKKEQE